MMLKNAICGTCATLRDHDPRSPAFGARPLRTPIGVAVPQPTAPVPPQRVILRDLGFRI